MGADAGEATLQVRGLPRGEPLEERLREGGLVRGVEVEGLGEAAWAIGDPRGSLGPPDGGEGAGHPGGQLRDQGAAPGPEPRAVMGQRLVERSEEHTSELQSRENL